MGKMSNVSLKLISRVLNKNIIFQVQQRYVLISMAFLVLGTTLGFHINYSLLLTQMVYVPNVDTNNSNGELICPMPNSVPNNSTSQSVCKQIFKYFSLNFFVFNSYLDY